MTSNNKSRILTALKIYAVLAAVGAAALTASLLLGISICPIYIILGLPCPSCGMSRAFTSLPQLGAAFFYHPLFFLVPILPLGALFHPRTFDKICIVAVVLFTVVWIVRMIMFFPHTAPMDFNHRSVVGWLFF